MRWVSCLFIAGCEFVHGALPEDAATPDSSMPPTIDGSMPDTPPSALVATIGASEDDALEDPDDSMLVAYSWVSIYSADHWGALRFQLAGVARNATIYDAYLELVIDSTNEDSPNIVLATEASSTPAALATTSADISSRSLGSARVTWNDVNIGQGMQRTPSLRDLVQERVSDASWSPGARILFVVDGLTGSNFEFRQYDHTAGAYAARLHVSYTNP